MSNNAMAVPTLVTERAHQGVYELTQAIQRVLTREHLAARINDGRTPPPTDGLIVVTTLTDELVIYAHLARETDTAYIEQCRTLRAYLRGVGRCTSVWLETAVFVALQSHAARQSEDSERESHAVETLYLKILRRALALNASDIHIVQSGQYGFLSYRVFGEIVFEPDGTQLTDDYSALCSHLYNSRIAAQGDGNWQPNKACNGVDEVEIDGLSSKWRFHSYPNQDADHAHIVVRRIDRVDDNDFVDVSAWDDYSEAHLAQRLHELGYTRQHQQQLLRMFTSPCGGIYVCGKVNAGKTTLLNVALSGAAALSQFKRLFICIEDVPELSVPRAICTPVSLDSKSEAAALGFVDAITSALRRDGDVIVIGEIRAADSGDAVKRAIATGHLLVSTIHVNSLLGIPERLAQLGIERGFVGGEGNTAGFVWQRLIPTLCDCKQPIDPDSPVAQRLQVFRDDVDLTRVYTKNPAGCATCKGLNPGRIVAAEVLDFPTPDMQAAIKAGDTRTLESLWRQRSHSRGFDEGVRAIDHAVAHVQRGTVCPAMAERELGRFEREAAPCL